MRNEDIYEKIEVFFFCGLKKKFAIFSRQWSKIPGSIVVVLISIRTGLKGYVELWMKKYKSDGIDRRVFLVFLFFFDVSEKDLNLVDFSF